MVRDAEGTARSAELTTTNTPGMCLQWCRQRADIPALYGTAAIAWAATDRKQFDRNPPRGAFVFWTGGSRGFGHIAISLGNGLLRSTDAGGSGRVATRTLAWFEANWPSQTYAGWADNVNGITVPGVVKEWDEMATKAELAEVFANQLAPVAARVETLVERTEGLRVTLSEIGADLDVLQASVTSTATKELVRKMRDQVIAALSFPGESA